MHSNIMASVGLRQASCCWSGFYRQNRYCSLRRHLSRFEGELTSLYIISAYLIHQIEGAELVGAAGVLIYSDPRDDGFVTVENGYATYPSGPARNPASVQRGSAMYLSMYPGDPTTPGYPAYENAERTEKSNIPKIPSLPISWHNAQRLLAEINGTSESRQLSGQSSSSKIRLVNHGEPPSFSLDVA